MASSSESTEASPPIPITRTRFPANTRTSRTALIHGLKTVATRTLFSDKIVVTVSQGGRLGHWTQTPLLSTAIPTTTLPTTTSITSSSSSPDEEPQSESLLPNPHLTPTPLLGSAAIPSLDLLAQTLATQIASAIQARDGGEEERTLVLGTGLDRGMVGDREAYGEMMGLVLEVL